MYEVIIYINQTPKSSFFKWYATRLLLRTVAFISQKVRKKKISPKYKTLVHVFA